MWNSPQNKKHKNWPQKNQNTKAVNKTTKKTHVTPSFCSRLIRKMAPQSLVVIRLASHTHTRSPQSLEHDPQNLRTVLKNQTVKGT